LEKELDDLQEKLTPYLKKGSFLVKHKVWTKN
jgi:hypothetical protein